MRSTYVLLLLPFLFGCASARPVTAPITVESSQELIETELGKTWHVKGPQFAPKLVKRVAPVYSEELRARQIDGPVYLDALIDGKGNVVDVRIRESPAAELAQAASAAVRQWKFSPKIVDGAA